MILQKFLSIKTKKQYWLLEVLECRIRVIFASWVLANPPCSTSIIFIGLIESKSIILNQILKVSSDLHMSQSENNTW